MRFDAEKVYLRPMTRRDVKKVFAAIEISRDEIRQWLPWVHWTRTEADTLIKIRKAQSGMRMKSSLDMGIFDAKTGDFLGNAGLHYISMMHGNANLGYWVRSDRHREGIASAAAATLLRYAFDVLGLHKVNARANPDNEPSMAMLRKLGFKKEAVLRDDLRIGNKWCDFAWHGMLVSEYRDQIATLSE
jgi:ribosomal-protein-serine acetyltransferase